VRRIPAFAFILGLLSVALFWTQCQTTNSTAFSEPSVSLSGYQLPEGFQAEVIAAEPQVIAPVAMDIDGAGRLWVAEMQTYMSNAAGTDEEVPQSRIVILEDTDGNGKMDHTQVFLDSLVLPRALCLAYGGLLYAEPPNLWFVEIEGDQPGARTLVDSAYTAGGNVEHQPNALLWNLDNWIYNAKANVRYRKVGEEWKKELTTFRGQWGMTHDDFGRLYFNNNSTLLQGDQTLPNALIGHRYLPLQESHGQRLTTTQRVYPIFPAAVNRGYMDGVLDSAGLLVNATCASGPVVYRGQNFPKAYYGNAFIPEPAANLLKRVYLPREQARTRAEFAWNDREFLACRDEAFRPVNLYNSPDGALYVVDMHKGIVQHKTYMTAYLREEIIERQLDTINHQGRILKVVYEKGPLEPAPNLVEASDEALVGYLTAENGWVRDKAQQALVSRQATGVKAPLEALFFGNSALSTRLHALWALEGLGAIDGAWLAKVPADLPGALAAHVAYLMPVYGQEAFAAEYQALLAGWLMREDIEFDLYLAHAAGRVLEEEVALALLSTLASRYPADALMAEAALSGLDGLEATFSAALSQQEAMGSAWKEKLALIAEARTADRPANYALTEQKVSDGALDRGLTLYRSNCMTCHGADAAGIDGVAPPLLGSEYITEQPDRLALILLHGMQGPLTIDGKRYEYGGVMPGLATNSEFSDADIAAIITFLRNAYGNDRSGFKPERIKELRAVSPPEGELFTEQSLEAAVKEL
jgi:mono/diheme cytochrome c family protein/glucose/arabinose dehydrogenase